jgi:hypothetical protein
LRIHKTKLLLVAAVLVAVSLACANLFSSPTTTPQPDTTPVEVPSPPALNTILPEDNSPSRTPLVGGTVLFQDDFTDPGTRWDQFRDEIVATEYADGAYLVGVYTEKRINWANPNLTFNNVVIKVYGQKITGGEDMQYGIICRHADTDNWYALVISADGYAAIRKRTRGGILETITAWVQVPAINTGNDTNALQAECIGDRLSLFVNGELAVETFDAEISSGDAGLLAGTFSEPQTEVLFTNFVVHEP